jgi:hypothetical protein
MKHILLYLFILVFSSTLFAQRENTCINCGNNGIDNSGSSFATKAAIMVYPNPVTDYIAVSDDNDRVVKLEFYNLTGRQMRTFAVQRGEKYNVLDLADGVYFVRLIDKNNRIVTTQRVTKR